MPPTKERLTARQREALERRTRMTQRRQELTSRIRKQKKSQYLQKKRSLPCATADASVANADLMAIKIEFRSLLDSGSKNPSSLEQLLSTLERFVSLKNSNAFGSLNTFGSQLSSDNPLVLLEQEDTSLAVNFLKSLREYTVEAISRQQTAVFQTSLRILVHLTSISSSEGIGSSTADYYGSRPATWPELLISTAPTQTSASVSTPSWLDILVQALLSSREVELTSLVLGNLAGDESAGGTLFRAMSSEFKTSLVTGLMRSVSPATPTAAWTLTNMIRNDSVSYASSYCSESLLSSSLLTTWLREPTLATQTAWMIASLTAREEETVQYLCGKQHSDRGEEFPFLSSIVESLQKPLQRDQDVPLVQALGNLACHPSLVGPLLTQTSPRLIPLLQTILSTASSRNPVLTQAAWLVGCLLVDVGVQQHPSTTLAAPALIPVLMERLGRGSESARMGNPSMACMTLEEEREFVCALCNALEMPPTAENQLSSSFELPFKLDISSSVMLSLVRLINSNDADAVISGVNLVNVLLRRFDEQETLQTLMQEEGMPDALDKVCDSQMYEAADIAAELLDDFFYNDDLNDMGATDNSWASELPTFAAPPSFGTGFNTEVTNGMGRGRGRGATMPAWMTK